MNLCPKATFAIDYRCSWDFWRWACIYYDRYDPGPDEVVTLGREDYKLIPVSESGRDERKQTPNLLKEVEQLKGMVLNLMAKDQQRQKRSTKL